MLSVGMMSIIMLCITLVSTVMRDAVLSVVMLIVVIVSAIMPNHRDKTRVQMLAKMFPH